VGGCGAAKVSKEVPLSLATQLEPQRSISAGPESAAVVFVYDGFPIPSLQAMTVVGESGQFLAQIRPHSYAVAQVRPGYVGFYAGRPELGYHEWCHGLRGEVAAGKVYVFAVGSSFGSGSLEVEQAPRFPPEKMGSYLSLFSQLGPDTARGQAETNRVEADFWKPCMDAQGDQEAMLAKSGLEHIENFRGAFAVRPEDGYDSPLAVPEPP
jgi:hypothetical protein